MCLSGQLYTKDDQNQDEDKVQYEPMIAIPYQEVQKMVSRSMVRNHLSILQEEEQEDLPALKIQKMMGRGDNSKASTSKTNQGGGIVGYGD